MYRQVLRNDLRAASLHRGIIKALKILDLLDYVVKQRNFMNLSICSWFIHHRNMIWRVSKVNGEWGTVEMLALGHIVDKVNDHPRRLHERKSKNGVDRDMWTCRNDKRCFATSLRLVWEVELPANFQLGCHSGMFT